jgi:hypothetical protein
LTYPADLFGFEDEVFDLYMNCKFLEALKVQGKSSAEEEGIVGYGLQKMT